MQEQKIHWEPQAKQELALIQTADEILYGGARGGGKTDCGQAWLLYEVDKPRYRSLTIRRNASDLSDWIDRAKIMYSPTRGAYVNNYFDFPSGARSYTGHLNDENAYAKYQGHEYQKMLIEELTHIPRESDYEKLLGSCRSTVEGIQPQVFATTNPDGPGYKWVKKRWRIPDNPTEPVYTEREVTLPDGTKKIRRLVFIPARVEDNPILMQKDPGYIAYLASLTDDDLREAWLKGSWVGMSVAGAYYSKQLSAARLTGRITQVPYDEMLPVHTWWDLGIGDSTVIGFFQVANNQWRLIDYHEATGEGLAYYAKILKDKGYFYGLHYAPHDIGVRELGSGKSRYEMAKALGINFEGHIDDNGRFISAVPMLSIDDGINAVRSRFSTLWIDEKNGELFVEALTQYRKEFNEKMGDYKPSPLHDWTSHAADMIRYWAVTKLPTVDTSMEMRVMANRSRNKNNMA